MFWNKLKSAVSSIAEKHHKDEIRTQKINIDAMREMLSDNQDILFTEMRLNESLALTVVFVDGMINSKMVDDDILKPLMQEGDLRQSKNEKELLEHIMFGNVYHSRRNFFDNLDDCIAALLGGSVVLVLNGIHKAVTFEIIGFEKRSITEPTNENVLKGSKESFIEVLRVNTAIVRRRLQTSDLKIHQLSVGRRSKTAVSVVFIEGLANQKIVDEVKHRVGDIDIDGIVSAGQIEMAIIDNEWSFFPQVSYTERADKFCANILEGRVGILIDGIPLAYIVPVNMNTLLQAPEDYSINYVFSSFFRLLRYTSTFLSLILPAFYVSVTTFHQEMIATDLAVTIIRSKQDIPFPTFVEVLLMLLAFEVLLEAGLRLPRAIGQAVSIVGALVVGEAAITAKILSPGVVIIIATSGITGFVSPSQELANTIRLCRLFLVVCSIIAGLFGVGVGLILILYHICTLEVFDVPYLSPFVANEGDGMLNDTLLRFPWFTQKSRPGDISPQDPERQGRIR